MVIDPSQDALKKEKDRLKSLLRRLFQFDVADLDFGIYRIMNQKRNAIEKFIEKDIVETVDSEFAKYESVGKEEVKQEVKSIKQKVIDAIGKENLSASGEVKKEYRDLPIVKQYYEKKKLLDQTVLSSQQKAEIFSHIFHFLSRYYQDGDFFSLRRYSKNNKYAIPYNGEEVILHWANKDQYYIKTGEYFNNYVFEAGGFKVNLKIAEANVYENNNISEKRFFLPMKGNDLITFTEEKHELSILFEYRDLNNEEKIEYGVQRVQEKILDKTKNKILSSIPDAALRNALQKELNNKTVLENHLYKYFKKNTTDYFIEGFE